MTQKTKSMSEKKLRVVVGEFPPLIIEDEFHYSGFEIDLWEAVAKKIGREFEYKKYPFKKIIP